MTPKQLSTELTRIAAAIESSRNPDRFRVVKDIEAVTRLASTPMVCITPGTLDLGRGDIVTADQEDLDLACAFLSHFLRLKCKVMGNKVCVICKDEMDCSDTREMIESMKYMGNASQYPECAEKDAMRFLLGKGCKIE